MISARAQQEGENSHPDAPRQLSLLGMAMVLLRQRVLVVAAVVAVFILVMVTGVLGPRTWTSEFSFVPRGSNETVSRLGGIAAQLGVSGFTPPAGLTPDVYREVVHSNQVLADVARANYLIPGTTADSSTLIEYFGVETSVTDVQIAAAVRALRELVGVSVAANTGLVSVRVTLKEPEMALQVAQRILLEINEFNRQSRQEHARAERLFLEDRIDEVEKALRAAENRMQQFLEGNRNWENAPGPRFAHDRLQRDLLMRQEVYIALSQSYEQTRLNEIRDTPAMTVIDEAVLPARPDGRRLVVRAVLALMLGTMVGVILAFIRDRGQDLKNEGDEEFAAFQALRSEALDDIAFWRRSRSTPANSRGDA